MKSPFRYFKTSPGIIRLAVMMQVRFPLSLRNVEDLRKLMKRYPRPDAIGHGSAEVLPHGIA